MSETWLLRDAELVPVAPREDLDQIRANLALTPAQRLEVLAQMDEFFLLARSARWLERGGSKADDADSKP